MKHFARRKRDDAGHDFGATLIGAAAAIFWTAVAGLHAADSPQSLLKIEHFDRDPGWDALNNQVVVKKVPTVRQDFGYSATKNAAKTSGELGGRVTRAIRPAAYADPIPAKTLNDHLSATGTFAITHSQSGAGVFFGYFNAMQPGGSGRPIGSLGLHMDFEGKGGRLAVRLITRENRSCGTFITKFEKYRTPELKAEMRPTPIKNDGTRYYWTMDYDPEANKGDGRFQFVLKSDSANPEDFEGKVFSVDLPPGYRQEGATFDRFGMMNMMKAGGSTMIYFGDLYYDGKSPDLSNDPGWPDSGNRASYEDRELVGAHNFGFSGKTSHAGGSPGEVGGDLWRSGDYGYYADRIGPLTLDQRLEAGGRVAMVVGGPDGDMYFGWFNSTNRETPPTAAGNFLGVHVGGPTRYGHCFTPAFNTAKGNSGKVEKGPALKPGKVYEWSLIYDSAASNGNGEIRLTLGSDTTVLPLKPGRKAEGASFDRFGLFTSTIGGQMVRIYLDDLKYTAGRK
jgi:hypothetical protein